MNQAMGKLAEKLGIDHAKLPREELAEIVCEKALEALTQQNSELADLKQYLNNARDYALKAEFREAAIDLTTALTFVSCFERRQIASREQITLQIAGEQQ